MIFFDAKKIKKLKTTRNAREEGCELCAKALNCPEVPFILSSMSGSKKKLMGDYSNFSQDEEWTDEKKDVIVLDDDEDEELPRDIHSLRPKRSTAKAVRYNYDNDDFGMTNEYAIKSSMIEPIKQYSGKRGVCHKIDPIASLDSSSSSSKKKSISSSEGSNNNTFNKRIDNLLDSWTKICPMDFSTLTVLRTEVIRSQRGVYQYKKFDDKITVSCVYFGILKYDYIRDYYQNYIAVSRAKECIKFCINRDPSIYTAFDGAANNENISNFEETVDFKDIEEVAIGPVRGYEDPVCGKIFFAALTLHDAAGPMYGGVHYHSQLSVISCGNRRAFDSAHTEATSHYENNPEKYSKGLQEWPSRYILLVFHNEKELENFNTSMGLLLPDRMKPLYRTYNKQIANYLAAHHACYRNLFDQFHLQKTNYEEALKSHSRRERKRGSYPITIDDNSYTYNLVVDPEDKITYFSYPFHEDAKDVITIFKGDLKCLLSFNYLNDALIDFKIKLLINESPAEIRPMIHSFHCSFGKNLLDAISGREYQAVSNWTNKIDLFKFKYVIVPMNKGMHWSVAVIVNPYNILPTNSEINEVIDAEDTCEDTPSDGVSQWRMDVHEDITAPLCCNTDSFIIFMDSLNMHNHLEMGDKLNKYLLEEWKDKKRVGELQPLRLVKCSVPRQQNGFDCGIFVIKYVAHFLQKCYEYETCTAGRRVNEVYNETFAIDSFTQEHATKEREDMLELCHTMAQQWTEWKLANPPEAKTTEDDDYIEHVK